MLYYLSEWLVPRMPVANVLTYITVRAGAAAFTAFLVTLIIGPWLIRRLRDLKIGQYIREEHVQDLHALHKGKAGTPTMGGALIVVSALASLILWAEWTNRLLWLAVMSFALLGAVGFLDDFVKLRRKHNHGLSARAKFIGQIAVGLALGATVTFFPITLGPSFIEEREITNWRAFASSLRERGLDDKDTPAKQLWEAMPNRARSRLERIAGGERPDDAARLEVLSTINAYLERMRLEDRANGLPREAERLLEKDPEAQGERAAMRLNRLLLEASLEEGLRSSTVQTGVEIPGLRKVVVPLGLGYILFVTIVIVAASNAVNLTDGLDGLAIGSSIMSLLAYTGIAYVVSRADWSQYLYLIYVPEATELAVFGATLVGAGMGFLWFNCHPAEVFMGDTGSLSLGGVIGAMAVLTKQELLLLVVGGLFVVEACSVIIQVASFKTRGKRVFKMAPIHHHFELRGWSETKVTIRFWIIALLFALMSLATLKLR